MRRMVIASAALLLLVVSFASLTADASTSITTKLGTHGAAKLTSGGPNELYVNLKGLTNGRWAEALYAGTCARLGTKIVGLPGLVASRELAIRTNTLTARQAVAARLGVVRIALESTRYCASFRAETVPIATPTPTPTPTAEPTPTPSPSDPPCPGSGYACIGETVRNMARGDVTVRAFEADHHLRFMKPAAGNVFVGVRLAGGGSQTWAVDTALPGNGRPIYPTPITDGSDPAWMIFEVPTSAATRLYFFAINEPSYPTWRLF